MRKTKLLSIIILTCSLFSISYPASAGILTQQVTEFGAAVGYPPATSLPQLVAAIIKGLLGVLGFFFFILILYGGYTYMTSAGEEQKVKKAKGILSTAVIGLFIIAISYAVANYIIKTIPWGEVTPSGTTPGTNTPPSTGPGTGTPKQ